MKFKKIVTLIAITDGKLLLAQSSRAALVGRFSTIWRYFDEEEKLYDEAIKLSKDKFGVELPRESFELIVKTDDPAAADPDLIITKYMLLVKNAIKKLPKPDDEFIDYKWYSFGDDETILSNTIKNHLLEYLKINNLLK